MDDSYLVALGIAQLSFLIALHCIVSSARSGYVYGKVVEGITTIGSTVAQRCALAQSPPVQQAPLAAAAQGANGVPAHAAHA